MLSCSRSGLIALGFALAQTLPAAAAGPPTPSDANPDYRAGGIVLEAVAAPRSPSVGALTIAELYITTQVAFGRPVDRSTVFPPDQPAVFAWFRWAGARPGSSLTGRLVFVASAGDIEAAEASAELTVPDDVGFFKFTPPRGGWPEGRYRLDLVSSGAALNSQEFRVARPK